LYTYQTKQATKERNGMITQPKLLTEDNKELMNMKVFIMATRQWMKKNIRTRFWVELKDIYFDYGQNWMYTAFITTDFADEHENSWQSFCPRDWELIVNTDSVEKLTAMAEYYMQSLYDEHTGKSLYPVFE